MGRGVRVPELSPQNVGLSALVNLLGDGTDAGVDGIPGGWLLFSSLSPHGAVICETQGVLLRGVLSQREDRRLRGWPRQSGAQPALGPPCSSSRSH